MNNKYNNEDIFLLLNLPYDDSLEISNISSVDNVKTFSVSRMALPTYCEVCGSRMHSKDIYTRTVNHPIFQDGSNLILKVNQRRWICKCCGNKLTEQFPFLERYSHSSNLTPLLILDAMKDLNRSTASIAKQFNMSDTQVHDIFTAYVDLHRLPLPSIISIDEVYLNISDREKYALVIMDFETGEIIDILHNRWENTAERYFANIPLNERKNVKYIISDAYKSYLDYPKKYFPNSSSILDSFHIVKIITDKLNSYVNSVMKRYKQRDREALQQKNHDLNLDNVTIKESREVKLLRNYRWVLLKNQDDINYSTYRHYHKFLQMYADTYTIEKLFFNLDKNFEPLRDLKEMYIQFNNSRFECEKDIEYELNRLIEIYEASDQIIFREFAITLIKYKYEIIRSFTIVEVKRKTKSESDNHYSRLSNGPMESFNRKPKDYKRNSRGFSNFDYTRNRILWATRKKTSIRGIPKTKKEIHSYKGKKRGPYNKKKKNKK